MKNVLVARLMISLVLLLASGSLFAAQELAPIRLLPAPSDNDQARRILSERTLVVAVEVDRDRASVVGYTVKPRPYVAPAESEATRAYRQGQRIQIEVTLFSDSGTSYMRRVDVGPLCFSHGALDESHVAGDTILLHRDTFLVELPEQPGMDRIEVAYHEARRGEVTRTSLTTGQLDVARFERAAGSIQYEDLAFAVAPAGQESQPTPSVSTVQWPETFGDTDIYRVYGNEAESPDRVNIVIVPDGYTYAEKAVMETHADDMVSHFRGKTPYKEHDSLINYILVYAYSPESGADECDCGTIVTTAMGTRFPDGNPTCGHSDNRCLYYGGWCDSSGSSNISAAELRAPTQDSTIVMVNTPRYGGCGGARGVYSAGNSSALEVAVHELGHSLAGLADEYSYNNTCGTFAGEVNTSLNATKGAWAEWIPDLGVPHEGAQYNQQCVYRPQANCEMRSLNQPFCAVCNQHWSLTYFGHPNVAPTAPISGGIPAATSTTAYAGAPTPFTVETRLAVGANVTNEISWTVNGPGFAADTIVAGGVTSHTQIFPQVGQYTLTSEVIADTNFIKPARYGANVDSRTWTVDVSALALPPEVSAPGAVEPLVIPDRTTLTWEDASAAGAFSYNVYRGTVSELPGGGYGSCVEQGVTQSATILSEDPPSSVIWFYLVSGENPVGEGPLGLDSQGNPRISATSCD